MLMATLGFFLGGCIADKLGKKLTILVFNILAYAFWLITAFANEKHLLYSTYALQGFFGAIAFNCVGK